jgi:polyphosphate kinase
MPASRSSQGSETSADGAPQARAEGEKIVRHERGEPRFFHRDLSWLAFNRRVLAQAEDPTRPLLERLRFMSIFTSNLDEFFMKRVGIVKRVAQSGVGPTSPDGRTPRQQLSAIREEVAALTREQTALFEDQLAPALAKEGVHFLRYADLSARERDTVRAWFHQHVFSSLTPLAVDPTHRFPFISNLSNNLGVLVLPPVDQQAILPAIVQLQRGGDKTPEAGFVRVKIPTSAGHFVRLADKGGTPHHATYRFVPVQEVIREHLHELLPAMQILERISFRITRSAGIQRDELDTANLLQSIEADLKQRRFARVVRVEIDAGTDQQILRWLLDKLNVDPQDVYERPAGFDFLGLSEVADIDRPDLRHKPWKPVVPPRLAGASERTPANFFATLRKHDVLVHHPYESFKHSVEAFIGAAAADPDVVTIKQTLYRTTPDSPFVENLVRAAESGKQVACLVELRARFDEGRNVRFARQLERAGVHVAYGVMGLKTHCKTSLVVRKEKHGLRCYAHLGTGNYHPKTAQLYTDLGLLTSDEEITSDLVLLFNYLTGMSGAPACKALLIAPFTMRQRINQMIDREIELARKGKPARIWAKLNALEDRDVTERLYAASAAGVDVRLIIRGFCCLMPGVKGLSENIRVSSVVGRFLEHSRVYHFSGGSDDPLDGDWYISSADWMYRNLSNRVEVACPVRDAEARRRILRMFEVHERDTRHAWDLMPDGGYARRTPAQGATADEDQALGSFEALMRDANLGIGSGPER